MRAWIEAHGVMAAVVLAAGIAGALASQTFTRPPPPTIEVRTLEPQATAAVLIYAHVDGAVESPGVYSLPTGARVFEAIDSAGGATDDADLSALNLAAPVADGQKLVVPTRFIGGGVAAGPGATVAASPTPQGRAGSTARINVNTATQRVLESLPGIGPVTAGRIIQYRQANGPFARIEQLRDARLVTSATFERIKDLITV